MHTFGLNKNQRLCSQRAIDRLFSASLRKETVNGNVMAYPWRAVWVKADEREDNLNKILISVPKKKLRKGVDRVKMRRRCREAYRLNQHCVGGDLKLDIAFIYVSDRLSDYSHTQKSVLKILSAIDKELSEKMK